MRKAQDSFPSGEIGFKHGHGVPLQTRETAQLVGAHKSGEAEVEDSGVSGEGGGEGVTSPISSHGLPAADAVVPTTASMSARAILAPPCGEGSTRCT